MYMDGYAVNVYCTMLKIPTEQKYFGSISRRRKNNNKSE